MTKSARRWLGAVFLVVVGVAAAAPDSPLFVPNFFGPGGYHAGLPTRYWLRRLHHTDAEVRRHAARTLGALGADAGEAVPALADAMLADADRRVRIEAALALTKMGPASREALPALAQALADHDPMVRLDATLALLVLGAEARPAVPALLRALGDERNPTNCGVFSYTIQELTALALGRASTGTDAAVPALTELLASADRPETREAAARSLGEVGPAAVPAAPQLRGLLRDQHEAVRQAAAAALGRIEGGTAGR